MMELWIAGVVGILSTLVGVAIGGFVGLRLARRPRKEPEPKRGGFEVYASALTESTDGLLARHEARKRQAA